MRLLYSGAHNIIPNDYHLSTITVISNNDMPDTGHRMGNCSIVVGPTDGDVALAGHSKSHVPGVHGVQGHVPRVKSSQLCVTLQFAM